MRLDHLTIALLLGVVYAMPGSPPPSSAVAPPSSAAPTPTPAYSAKPDCGDKCGGTCGDKIVQSPQEECDLGPELNGKPGSGCT